jgi:hypothetical protein
MGGLCVGGVGGVGGVLGGSSGLWFVGVKLNTVEKVEEMAIGEPGGTKVPANGIYGSGLLSMIAPRGGTGTKLGGW